MKAVVYGQILSRTETTSDRQGDVGWTKRTRGPGLDICGTRHRVMVRGIDMMKGLLEKWFFREKHVCPWWCCFTFDNFLRKLFHHSEDILRPYIVEGNTVLDIGPGMGYFSIPLARMVGERGKVIAADVQPEMLTALRKRARRAGVEQQIITHLCKADSLGLNSQFDFILAFWMVHEVPDPFLFFKELKSLLKPSGNFLLSEPILHVNQAMYEKTVKTAESAGLVLVEKPKISLSRSALFAVK